MSGGVEWYYKNFGPPNCEKPSYIWYSDKTNKILYINEYLHFKLLKADKYYLIYLGVL